MLRVLETFASGQRVYAAGTEVAEDDPVVKGREYRFARVEQLTPLKRKRGSRKSEEGSDADQA